MRPYPFSQGTVICRTILVGLALITAGLFAITQARAQGDLVPSSDPDMPFTEAYNSGYNYHGTAIRMSYKSPAYGLRNDQFSLGLQNRRRTGDGALMLDGQYDLNLEHSNIMGLNVGFGQRWLYQSSFSETARIFGASVWYDGTNSELDNMLNQVGVSIESLGEMWDFRLNANLPVGTTRQDGTGVPTGEIGYFGYYLSEMTLIPIDQAVGVIDFEVARRIGHDNVWAWAGGYSLWEDDTDDSAFGAKAGVRGYVNDDLLLQLAVTSDEMFDTKVTFNLIWYPGRSSRRCRARHDIDDRLMEPVIRNNYIALKRDHKDGGNPLKYEDNELIRVVHVDSGATSPGDGSFESPFTSLDSIFGGSEDRDIVLVHSDTTYSGQHAVLLDNQRLLGEGNDIRHYVDVKDIGATALPATSAGALAGAIPAITNTVGDVVTLGSAETSREYDDVSTTSTNEVNNLSIDGGARGIVSSAVGIGQATIKNMTIANTTGNGIELKPFVETIVQADDSETKRVLFSPTIDTVALTSVVGNGIDLDATTAEPAATPVTESINVLDVTSTDGTGQGISITGNKSAAAIDTFAYDGGATAAGGILFTNSAGGATIADSTITGGAGTGISIVKDSGITGDSTGSFTITDTTITDTLGAAFHIDGGSSNVDFTGLISQNENAAAVSIVGDHTGTVNFNEATADAGVIMATAGTGLVFGDATSGANGIYNFNHGVELASVITGIDIKNSDGIFTFSDTLIENATTAAMRIDDGSADVVFSGQIVQNANGAGTAVDILGGHTGPVIFTEGETSSPESGNGVIVATYGDGLQFDAADGSYSFNDPVSLSGSNMTAGISITNDSSGLFTFSDTRITDIGGVAFNLNGGTATVNFTGRIEQDVNAFAAVNIAGNHTGTANFNEATADEGVIMASTGTGLTFNGADGTYNFNHAVELSGTSVVDIDSSDGTFNFASSSTISNTSGTAFTINGGEAVVTYDGTIDSTVNGRPVEIANNSGGWAMFTGTITGTGTGILVDDNDGGIFQFSGLVDLDTGTDNAVDFTNNDNATLAFSNLNATTTDGVGFNAVGDGTEDGGSVQLTGSNNTIVTTGTGVGINMSDVQIAASGAAFKSVSVDGAASGIVLNNVTGGLLSVAGGTITGTGSDGVSVTNTANVSLNNMQITNTTGDGVSVTHDNALAHNVTIADCTINTTTGEGISLNATGSGTMRLTLNSNNVVQAGAEQAVDLLVNTSGGTYITLDGNTFTNSLAGPGAAQEAFVLTVDGGTCTFEAETNTFSSNDDEASFDIQVNNAATLNATIHNLNSFTSGGGGTARGLLIAGNDTSTVRLSLLDNTAGAASGEAPFLLQKDAGSTFGVVLLETPAGTAEVPKVDEVNRRNGGSGTYADYTGAGTPASVGWVIEFLPDAAPLTPPMDLGFSNLDDGDVPTP